MKSLWFQSGITYPEFGENVGFEIKPVMLQMILNFRQFVDNPVKDTHNHKLSFYYICTSFHMSGISTDELQSALFPSTLKDELKRLKILYGQVTTWEDLIENFIKKFFPSVENAKRRQNLMLLKQRDRENLPPSRHFLHSQMRVDGGILFLPKESSYNQIKAMLNSMVNNSQEWDDIGYGSRLRGRFEE